MPFLVRPNYERCREFLSRPNTYTLKLPGGGDMYFSVPVEVDSLPMLSEPDLYAFHGYLPEILDDVMKTMGHLGVDNVRCVMRMIEDRLIATRNLTSIECDAWNAGYGFPEFDEFNNIISFFWNWDVVHFERGSEVVAKYAFKVWESDNPQSPKRRNVSRSALFMKNDVRLICWEKNGQCAFEWTCNGYTVCFAIHGGFFRDYAEWMSCRDSLKAHELRLLEEGFANIASLPSGDWEPVGPADRLHPTVKPQPYPKRHDKHDVPHPVNEAPEHKKRDSGYPTAHKPNSCKDCGCVSSSTLTQESDARQQNNNPFEHSRKAQESPHRPTKGRSQSGQAGLVDVKCGPAHKHASLVAPPSPSRPRYTAKQLDQIEARAQHEELFKTYVSLFEREFGNSDDVAREARMQRDAEQRMPMITESESKHPDAYYGPAHERVPTVYRPLERTDGIPTARGSASSPRISHGHHEQRAQPPTTTVNPFASTYHQMRSDNTTRVPSCKHTPQTATASSTGTSEDSKGSAMPRYQAYAEDSQEDSPRPRPGSWRDV